MLLGLKDVIAEVQRHPRATLEGYTVEYAGSLKRVQSLPTEMQPVSGEGAVIAELLCNQQVIVKWGLRSGRQYGSLSGLDGKVKVDRYASGIAGGFVYDMRWEVSTHWLNVVHPVGVLYSYKVSGWDVFYR